MKEFFSRYRKHKWKFLVAFAFFVIGVPCAINILFKIKAHGAALDCELVAGDVLAFYGTLLASATTILGAYITIADAQKKYREDEKNRVKPYFALTCYEASIKIGFFNENQATKNITEKEQVQCGYKEYRLNRVYIIINETGIEWKKKLSTAQQQRLELGWLKGGINSNLVSVPFEAENVGNGAAANTMLAFYKKGEARKSVGLYTVKQGDSFYFHIYCDDAEIVNDSEYVIEIIYKDIIGNYYSQEYPVSFDKEVKTNCFRACFELKGTQKSISINEEEDKQ